MSLAQGTNLSEGRGTTLPFEQVRPSCLRLSASHDLVWKPLAALQLSACTLQYLWPERGKICGIWPCYETKLLTNGAPG